LQITGNKSAYDTANREDNPYAGMLKPPITSPWLDTTAWYLMSTMQSNKPMLLTMREQPNLLHSEFNPNFPDGGRYIFHFYARYDVYYGDWRLAIQGNT
jgi:phage major head subunit gpT-like protein